MDFIDLKTQQSAIKTSIQSRINQVLDHGKYIMGPEVVELEKWLEEYTGAKFAVTCANGTDALSLALLAAGIKPGDEVITPAFSFFAAAEAIALHGAIPIFADVEKDTCLIDPDKISSLITDKTKAIIPVSLYGQMPDFDKIQQIADQYNLVVIEDAAQSFGASQNGVKSCAAAELATTSFFPSKPLGCYGDGGAVFTNNPEYAEKLKMLRTHGARKRYFHEHVGLNSRLDSIQAAILLCKLEIFDSEVHERNQVADYYSSKLKDYFNTPVKAPNNTHVYAQYTLQVENRTELIENLKKEGIPTAVHYPIPLHEQPALSKFATNHHFPTSELLSKTVMSIPMHPYLTKVDQDRIVDNLLKDMT